MSATNANPHIKNAIKVITRLLLTELLCPSDNILFNQFINDHPLHVEHVHSV
jgi:hypothetical protein